MNILNHYTNAFRNYADFKGKATRPQFWYFALFHVIAIIVLSTVDNALGTSLFATIYLLAALIPALAIGARRLHDAGHSGWWILIGLIPVLGAAVLIILYVQPSKGSMRPAPEAAPQQAAMPAAQPIAEAQSIPGPTPTEEPAPEPMPEGEKPMDNM